MHHIRVHLTTWAAGALMHDPEDQIPASAQDCPLSAAMPGSLLRRSSKARLGRTLNDPLAPDAVERRRMPAWQRCQEGIRGIRGTWTVRDGNATGAQRRGPASHRKRHFPHPKARLASYCPRSPAHSTAQPGSLPACHRTAPSPARYDFSKAATKLWSAAQPGPWA